MAEHDTFAAQLRWIEAQADRAVRVSGVRDEWCWLHGSVVARWCGSTDERATVLGSLIPTSVAGGSRIACTLVARGVTDALAVAERIGECWNAEHRPDMRWDITEVRGGGDAHYTHIRADREDGAMLSCEARGETIILGISGTHSTHPTLIEPTSDLRDRDAFIAEVLARENGRT